MKTDIHTHTHRLRHEHTHTHTLTSLLLRMILLFDFVLFEARRTQIEVALTTTPGLRVIGANETTNR